MSVVKPSYCPSSTGFGLFAPIDPKRSFTLYNDLCTVFSTPKSSKSEPDQFSLSSPTKSPQCSRLKTECSSVDSDIESESDDDDDEELPPYSESEFSVIRHDVPYQHSSTLNSASPSPTLWARVGSFALSLKCIRGVRS